MLLSFSKLVHGSTGRAFPGRSSDGSSQPSPRSNGMSCRQNILRSVFISVMVCFTLRTIPFANGQGQRFENVPTAVAALTGRIKAVDSFESLFIPTSFVLQLTSKHPKSGIRQASCQSMVLDHSSKIQILNADRVEPSNQIGSYLVDVVGSGVCDLSMNLSNPKLSPLFPVASFLSSGQNTLGSGKFLLGSPKVLRIGNSFSSGQRSKSRNPKINTYGKSGLGKLLDFLVQVERDKVSPSTILGYRNGAGITFKRPGPSDLETSKFCNRENPTFLLPLEGRFGVLSGLLADLLLERWITGSLLEEVLVGGLEMSKCLLFGNTGNFIEPGVIGCFFECGECNRRGIVVDSCAGFKAIGTQAQSPVVDVSTASKSMGQRLLLCSIGIKPKFVFYVHKHNILFVRQIVKSCLKGLALPPHA